ncbi:MAG: phosphatase PAP2 family protein [Desulfatibacillaceae bacterium]
MTDTEYNENGAGQASGKERPLDNPLVRGGVLAGGLFLLLVAATWLLVATGADLAASRHFYCGPEGFCHGAEQPWLWLYEYGTMPGLLFTLAGLGLWFVAMARPKYAPWRRYALLVVLTTVIGSGVFVNSLLKPYWGRPRPEQTAQFNGHWEYRTPFSPGIPGKGRSFPSGHASMGFAFVSLVFWHRRSRAAAYAGGAVTAGYGGMVGAARIVQGAHFLTDVLWSFGVMTLTAGVLYYFVLRIPQGEEREPAIAGAASSRQKRLAAVVALVAAAVIVLFFMARRPFYENIHMDVNVTPNTRVLRIVTNVPLVATRVLESEARSRILFDSKGFGLFTADLDADIQSGSYDHTSYVSFDMEISGYLSELNHEVVVLLPPEHRDRVRVVFEDEQDLSGGIRKTAGNTGAKEGHE